MRTWICSQNSAVVRDFHSSGMGLADSEQQQQQPQSSPGMHVAIGVAAIPRNVQGLVPPVGSPGRTYPSPTNTCNWENGVHLIEIHFPASFAAGGLPSWTTAQFQHWDGEYLTFPERLLCIKHDARDFLFFIFIFLELFKKYYVCLFFYLLDIHSFLKII